MPLHISSALKGHPTTGSSSTQRSRDPYTSSTLRSRLFSREPSEVEATTSERPAYPDIYQQVNASFEKSCNQGEEVTPGGASPKNNEAVTQLRDAFARAGDKLHKSAMLQLHQAHAEIQSKIDAFDEESSTILTQFDNIYKYLSSPLSSTRTRVHKFPSNTLAAHLSNLKKEFQSATQQLQRLGEEWHACDQNELNAWKELASETKTPKRVTSRVDPETEELMASLKEEAQDIVDSKFKRASAIHKEYKRKIQQQREILMRTMMSDSDDE